MEGESNVRCNEAVAMVGMSVSGTEERLLQTFPVLMIEMRI